MKTVQIKGEVRENLGKKDAAQIRANGGVPCVVYGGEAPIHFSAPSKEFNQILFTPDAYLVEIEVGGNTYTAILKDTQFNPVTDALTHADFLIATADKPVVIDIPVVTKGNAVGVVAGGNLQKILRKLTVKGTSDKLPDFIEIDVTNVELGGSVKVKDLAAIDGVEIVNVANAVIVRVQVTRTAILGADDEAGAEEVAEGAEAEAAAAE